MNRLFVINPYAGKGRAIKYVKRIERIMANHNAGKKDKVYIEITKKVGDATTIVKDYISKLGDNNLVVYAIGGDGTLNEVVNAAVYTKTQVVVVPCGTGNDYVKNISKYMSGRKIIIESLDQKPKRVDTIFVNDKQYAVNMINGGFDAKIVVNVVKFNKLPLVTGNMAFNLSILYTLFMNQNYRFEITVDDRVFKGKYTLVAVGKGKYCGGVAKALPYASLDDGMLDVCIAKESNVIQKIGLLR